MPLDARESDARDATRMRHMLDAARRAVEFCRNQTAASLSADRMRQDAVIRTLEVVGEAAGKVSEGSRNRFHDIPWRQARELRNRVIHGYDTVNIGIVLDTVRLDIPVLIDALDRALAALPPPSEPTP